MATTITSEAGRRLRPGEFYGTCSRGHDALEFTDGAAWVAHHKDVHKRRQHTPGGSEPFKGGDKVSVWGTGPAKPRPWKAPAGKAPDLRAWVNSGDLEIDGVELEVPPTSTPADRVTSGHILVRDKDGIEHRVPARRCGEWAAHKAHESGNGGLRFSHAPTGKLAWNADSYTVRKLTDLDPLLLELGPVAWDDDPGTVARVRAAVTDFRLGAL